MTHAEPMSVAVDGNKSLYVERWTRTVKGDTPILCVHGGPGLFGYMKGLAENLSLLGPVWDYYQRGGNHAAGGPFTLETHSADLEKICGEMVAMYGRAPVVVAHSWGALLSLITAKRRPDLFRKLVLVGPMPLHLNGVMAFAANIDQRLTAAEQAERLARMGKLLEMPSGPEKNALFVELSDAIFKTYQKHPEAIGAFSSRLESADADCFFQTHGDLAVRMQSQDLLADIRGLEVPVAMVYGDYDPSPCDQIAMELAERLPAFKSFRLEGCGHYPWWEGGEVTHRFFGILEGEIVNFQ